MEIKSAKLNDLEAIVELNKQFHLDIPNFKWDTPQWTSQEIKRGNYFVLSEENETLGAICLRTKDEGMCIETLAVKSGLHKRGFGKALVEYAKTYAKKQGQRKLIVESFLDYGLENFYTGRGFLKSVTPYEYAGKKYNRYFMYV